MNAFVANAVNDLGEYAAGRGVNSDVLIQHLKDHPNQARVRADVAKAFKTRNVGALNPYINELRRAN